jgi:hippurate hydrolase
MSEPVVAPLDRGLGQDREAGFESTYLRRALFASVGEFICLRREIHSEPELGFEEHRTAALVAEKLSAWGYEVERGVGGTGVVGRLRRGTGSRALGIRADMDALPIAESSGAAWSSRRPGLMHACGHDGHTAMLLAAARNIAENGEFSGTLNLIFQPAEETGGGALRMIEDGLFVRYPCDAVFAAHNIPGVPQGHLVFRDGAAMASSDSASVTLTGVGGHGAMPHRTADPIVAAAGLITALQTVVSRNVDPMQMAVVTVGAIHSGHATNVIPGTATLDINVRALDPGVREQLEIRVKAIVHAQAASFGVKAEIDWRKGYAVLVNSPGPTDFARRVGVELRGAAGVTLQGVAQSASEDFAFMLEHVPGSYLLIGNGDGEGSCMVHHSGYDFNDDNIAIGADYWTLLVERYLPVTELA